MKEDVLVSIITPAYNAAAFIAETIASVQRQTYENWELLIVNDGSTDETSAIVQQYQQNDERIHLFEQANKGVGAARNLALANRQGAYFCFLDADDIMPSNSLRARLNVFEQDAGIEFVDGAVLYKDAAMQEVLKRSERSFSGQPLQALARLDSRCFLGNTWMIKVKPSKTYRFRTDTTHSEDILFYLSIADTGKYAATDEVVLHYRQTAGSAMTNLDGLQKGYQALLTTIQSHGKIERKNKRYARFRIMRIMFLSFLRNKQPLKALKAAWLFWRL